MSERETPAKPATCALPQPPNGAQPAPQKEQTIQLSYRPPQHRPEESPTPLKRPAPGLQHSPQRNRSTANDDPRPRRRPKAPSQNATRPHASLTKSTGHTPQTERPPTPLRVAATLTYLIKSQDSRIQGSPQLVLLPSLKQHLHPKRQSPRRVYLHRVQASRHAHRAPTATSNSATRDLHCGPLRSARQNQSGAPRRRPATAQNRKKRDQKTQPRPIQSQVVMPQQRRPRHPRRP